MSCCLPFLSGILPPSVGDKLIVDVSRGGEEDDTSNSAPQVGSMTSFLGLFGVGKKSADEETVEEDIYEKFYRLWYKKGLLCFKPKSLGGSGSAALVRRLEEQEALSDALPTAAATAAKASESIVKTGHDWSKQSSVESKSQTEGRSLRNYWEERSSTSSSKPETAPKSVQVEQ